MYICIYIYTYGDLLRIYLGMCIYMGIWYIHDIYIEWYISDLMNLFMGIKFNEVDYLPPG